MEGDAFNFCPPVLVGERVAWLGSGSGLPQSATVRWIGHIPEITLGWTVGIELDKPMPIGGIDGTWRKRKLFSCEPKHGLLVPIDKIMKESSFLKTRHSLGEKFYDQGKPVSQHNQDLVRQLSLPQSASSREFLARVLPPADKKCKHIGPTNQLITFKTAANDLKNVTSQEENNIKVGSLTKSENFDSSKNGNQNKAASVRQQTLDELENFKKYLDELEILKHFEQRLKPRKKKIGESPDSLYELAKSTPHAEDVLFLRIIGEKRNSYVDPPRRRNVSKKGSAAQKNNVEHSDDKVGNKPVIFEERELEPTGEKNSYLKTGATCAIEHVNTDKDKEKAKKELKVNEAVTSVEPQALEETLSFESDRSEVYLAEERLEENVCTVWAQASLVEVLTAAVESEFESVNQPTPTIRKKRRDPVGTPPVPSARLSSSNGRMREDDISSILYEPAFLRVYLDEHASKAMSDVRGTFRRIDEDELDRRAPTCAPSRRILSTSVSHPGGTKKGIFSFLKWFRKNKPKDDLDLEAFNAPSVTASPLFTRTRLQNAESVDTLYSIATVSSFAFVPGAQYQSAAGSERRKKRRAPLPPPQRRDVSLPSTLENRTRQQHRRSVSESYKDRRSGAFAHVSGKRKAPAPPMPSSRERLYPSLSSVQDGSLMKKKRPAPLPPDNIFEQEADNLRLGVDVTECEEVLTPSESKYEPVRTDMVPVKDDNIVCNDTLRLERGVLKPNKLVIPFPTPPDVAKVTPTSPVSPRPWYKRKSLEKRKEKYSEEWMPEVGIPRPSTSPELSSLKNLFYRSDDKKKEEKRKSGLSLLANISELDREAAEICRKEQAHQQQLLASDDAKFYAETTPAPQPTETDAPKRNSTRELITLFNSIGNVTKITVNHSVPVERPQQVRASGTESPLVVSNKPEIKTASVIGTKSFVNCDLKVDTEKPEFQSEPNKSQALYDLRSRRHHSPSPTISTIAEISEPSSSAATLNQYAELVWTCTRCTLENLNWKNRCDACSACKPNFNSKKLTDKRKSEMDFEIDWEKELQKYFPVKKTPQKEEVSAKLTLSKTGDVFIKTRTNKVNELKEGDLDELRRKRLAFFMKSLGNEAVSSLRDAAAKKSLDEAEKLKLKGMLREMKNAIPKYEAAKNNVASHSNLKSNDSQIQGNSPSSNSCGNAQLKLHEDGSSYGAIRKIRKDAEALFITTKTTEEDIIVRKKQHNSETAGANKNETLMPKPVELLETVSSGEEAFSVVKKARRVGDGPFELMRPRDLENIMESKTATSNPVHVYANFPTPKVDNDSSTSNGSESGTGREVSRLASQLTRAAGVAEFKAGLDPTAADTLAVNRLLRRLEAAIAAGRHDQAATLARELASLKLNCSVTRQRPLTSPPTKFTVEMYVEDKVSHQGPIPVSVAKSMTLADLKLKIQRDFHIPGHVQRWILGKQLAMEDFRTLEELGVTVDRCPVFLYLVAPEPENDSKNIPSAPEKEEVEEAKALPKPTLGKGWYYNYEEDRYSYCESETDVSPERDLGQPDKAAAVRVIQRTIENAQENSRSSSLPRANGVLENENEEITLKSQFKSKQIESENSRPPLKTRASLPEAEKPSCSQEKSLHITSQEPRNVVKANSGGFKNDEEVGKSKAGPPGQATASFSRPRSRSIFDLIKPHTNDTLKKDLKVISVNAVKETIEKLTRRGEDVQRDGWKCAVCTLVNSAGRPGCAACTAPRPPGYAPPVPKPIENELRRLRSGSLDLPIMVSNRGDNDNQHYLQLVNLDNADLVSNTEKFECPVCLMLQGVGEGVVLRECLHTFCRACLAQTVEYNEEAEVKCPYRDATYSCESVLQQREIKALVPQHIFEQHLARSVSQAENRIGNAFHCKTPDCQGWCILEDNVNEFRCPVCSHFNCLTCQAIHEGVNCRTYQDRLRSSSDTNAEAKRTRTMLEEMVQKGDAMACPTCQVVLMKKWGCDWLRCSMCKTEICWVTRGPRWGPAGKGDTSAGCQCGINGVKCHPKCNYCH